MDLTELATPANIFMATGVLASGFALVKLVKWAGTLFSAGAAVGRVVPRFAFPLSMAGAGAAVDFASSNPDHLFAALSGGGALAVVAVASFLRTYFKKGDEVRSEAPFRNGAKWDCPQEPRK